MLQKTPPHTPPRPSLTSRSAGWRDPHRTTLEPQLQLQHNPRPPSGRLHPATGSKTTAVIALLERGEGATLAELIAATGWLPHTTRAALTGLRKKGHSIERNKRDDVTCYRIVKPA